MTRIPRRAARAALATPLALVAFAGCRRDPPPDAYGNFEATEVVVAAQTSGQVLRFVPAEGVTLAAGAPVASIDTVQLALERAGLVAQRAAGDARRAQAVQQAGALRVQRDIARRAHARTQRLFDQQAATAQQLDQAERDYGVLAAQLRGAEAQLVGAREDVAATTARLSQIADRIARSEVVNPVGGTVLATYARAGEFVQTGQPLYRIANLDTLELRAYVSQPQLSQLRLGQRVQVRVDRAGGERLTVPGTVSWISARAEFTPTPVETRDERASLVYALKVRVPNTGGALKIGMPADLALGTEVAAEGGRP